MIEAMTEMSSVAGRLSRQLGAQIAFEPPMSPHLQAEMQQIRSELGRLKHTDPAQYKYRLLTTRRLTRPKQKTVWQDYILGEKLLDTDPDNVI